MLINEQIWYKLQKLWNFLIKDVLAKQHSKNTHKSNLTRGQHQTYTLTQQKILLDLSWFWFKLQNHYMTQTSWLMMCLKNNIAKDTHKSNLTLWQHQAYTSTHAEDTSWSFMYLLKTHQTYTHEQMCPLNKIQSHAEFSWQQVADVGPLQTYNHMQSLVGNIWRM